MIRYKLGNDYNTPNNSSLNADAEADFLPMFTDTMKIIPGPELTAMEVAQNMLHLSTGC
jgi:hypothetical protein